MKENDSQISRRNFLKAAASATAGLVLAFHVPPALRGQDKQKAPKPQQTSRRMRGLKLPRAAP